MAVKTMGPLYGEVIQQTGDTYQQPFHLPDEQRQPLYHLGYELLNHLNASPAVYSLQFNITGQEIIFDRIFPFPHPSSIASLGIQSPDLLTCHWLCLTQQPILDLIIHPIHLNS
ncbi:MAG: fructosamine kinase family protein [Kamptonema sp. SIO4C4]|nr:fructosamine kinase family protein [Kamptonema sp. SIO4C4]